MDILSKIQSSAFFDSLQIMRVRRKSETVWKVMGGNEQIPLPTGVMDERSWSWGSKDWGCAWPKEELSPLSHPSKNGCRERGEETGQRDEN